MSRGCNIAPEKIHERWIDKDKVEHHLEYYPHEVYGLPLSEIITVQAQILPTDFYSFMDGVENVEVSNPQEAWYAVGVYIREKFSPVGTSKELVRKPQYTATRSGQLVKKWIVYDRPMPGCKRGGPSTILEVECELITGMEDPSVNFLPDGSFKARVLRPEYLHEEVRVVKDGVFKDVIMPPVYYSHFLFWTEHQAVAHATAGVRSGLEFEVRKKKRESFSEQDVQERVNLIQIVRLAS